MKNYLPVSVTSDFKLIRLKFGQTFFKVRSIMMSNPQSPTLDNMKFVLGAYDKTLKPQVAQCQDIRDILELVSDDSSPYDISLLEYFINMFNIRDAKPVIKEYKEAVNELKTKLRQFLEENLLKVSPLLKCVTIVVDEDISSLVLNDVQRVSSALLPHDDSHHIKLNVIRGGRDSIRGVWKQKSFTDSFDETARIKDTTLTTELPGTALSLLYTDEFSIHVLTTIYFECIGTQSESHSFQEEDKKEEDQVMLLQEREDKELHEKEKQFHEQVIKEYEEEILQQKKKLILNEEKIAALTQQHERVTSDLRWTQFKTEQYEELQSGYIVLTNLLLIDTAFIFVL